MLFLTTLKVALGSLISNKLRSFLAMLGIIIGVGAVISMLGLAAGARKQVLDRVTAMGANLLIIRPARIHSAGVHTESQRRLTLDDAEAILKEAAGVEAVGPQVMGRAQLKYYSRNTNTSIMGVAQAYLVMRNFEVEKGRTFSSVDEEQSSLVVILGPVTAETLFGKQDPVGESIRIRNSNFRVLGVLKAKGDQGWFNPDDMAVVPCSTAMKKVLGRAYVNEINVQVAASGQNEIVADAIAAILRRRHRIRKDGENDFEVRNQAEMVEMVSSYARTFTILLGGIASISLIVGGIGIMNIMLVTVTERTREIGVRKAIGARNRDILRQFLLEAVIISGLGGLLGIATGLGVASLISYYGNFPTLVEMRAVALAIAVSASVGVFFGFYPAHRASRLDPIVALRYE